MTWKPSSVVGELECPLLTSLDLTSYPSIHALFRVIVELASIFSYSAE